MLMFRRNVHYEINRYSPVSSRDRNDVSTDERCVGVHVFYVCVCVCVFVRSFWYFQAEMDP